MNDDHKCPKDGCEERVPYELLACRPHWYSLPKDLRAKIWAAWRDGDAVRHAQLITEAQRHLNGAPA